MAATPAQLLQVLQTPRLSLPQFGRVHDQESGSFINYDPQRITEKLQPSILSYFSAPPRTPSGHTKWMTLLGYRQGGKSTTAEFAAYCKAAYSPGWDHVCIADTKDRAEYLHSRLHHLHRTWPSQLRTNQMSSREVRQLTFDPNHGGKMRVLSAESGAVGVGQSIDSLHASEPHLWSDLEGSLFLLLPAIRNRKNCLALFEATPWERNGPWHDHYLNAKRSTTDPNARHFSVFFPYWDGKLNRRPWEKTWNPDQEELGLMNRYGPAGLTWDSLAFRRAALSDDPELRRNPERFPVMYPFDDIGCWIAATNSAIPEHVIEPHLKRPLKEWYGGPYQEYEAPQADALYAIGVDPSGYAARDHASFQILKVYQDEWTQVACFATHTDPVTLTRELTRQANRYNKARICVESNGVGQAVLALLEQQAYSNIYYEGRFKPGFTVTGKSLDQVTAHLIDALMESLILQDKDTIEQLQTYKNDKRIEESPNTEILRGKSSARRRGRHHWDKVSALAMAIQCARDLPQRFHPDSKPAPKLPENVTLFTGMSHDDREKYLSQLAEDKNAKGGSTRRATYRSVRRRRR